MMVEIRLTDVPITINGYHSFPMYMKYKGPTSVGIPSPIWLNVIMKVSFFL